MRVSQTRARLQWSRESAQNGVSNYKHGCWAASMITANVCCLPAVLTACKPSCKASTAPRNELLVRHCCRSSEPTRVAHHSMNAASASVVFQLFQTEVLCQREPRDDIAALQIRLPMQLLALDVANEMTDQG
eukprot:178030-Chlamydomonas_euryale.AAC.18